LSLADDKARIILGLLLQGSVDLQFWLWRGAGFATRDHYCSVKTCVFDAPLRGFGS